MTELSFMLAAPNESRTSRSSLQLLANFVLLASLETWSPRSSTRSGVGARECRPCSATTGPPARVLRLCAQLLSGDYTPDGIDSALRAVRPCRCIAHTRSYISSSIFTAPSSFQPSLPTGAPTVASAPSLSRMSLSRHISEGSGCTHARPKHLGFPIVEPAHAPL